MKGSFWNPFTTYSIAAIVVVFVYMLGFSSMFPGISVRVAVFLLFAVGSAILFALLVNNTQISRNDVIFGWQHERLLAGLCLAGFGAEFWHFGGVPLLQLLAGQDINYQKFGIPTFHVVLVGVSTFLSVYWWDCFLVTRSRKYFAISQIAVLGLLLAMSRGGVLILLLSFLLAYGNRCGLRRHAALLGFAAVAVILGFGYLGEVRMGEAGRKLILSIGGANEKFTDSGLPDVTFWFYVYVSSPLANLLFTELNRPWDIMQLSGLAADFLPDFVSNHLLTREQLGQISILQVHPALTVGTAYARPLLTLGWIGPYALHCAFLLFGYFAIAVSRGTRCHGALLALLGTQGCLMFFDNMLMFSGTIAPVLVGLALVCVQRLRSRKASA